MSVGRRELLLASLAGLAVSGPRDVLAKTLRSETAFYLSACTTFGGEHRFAGFTGDGEPVFETPLPGRAYGCCRRPNRSQAAVLARHPGTFIVIVDILTGQVAATIEAAPGRHFYGHGIYSADGRLLYATENAFDEAGRGVIGIYDAEDGYRRLGEMASHGVGPHELKLMPDGETLVVANGGIRTHPASGRKKLNLATMAPALVYVDRRSDVLMETARLSPHWHRNSIRHLDVTPDGGVGLQFEGPKEQTAPLVMMHRRGAPPRLLSAPADVQRRMR